MITFLDFQKVHSANSPGRARKKQSDVIMAATWKQDIQEQTAYAYDMFHDIGDEHFKLNDLHPNEDQNKVPISIKFVRHASQSYSSDPITYWLQLQPGHEYDVDYFEREYENKYKNIYPIGLYFDIMDESGKYNKWLCVNTANYNQNQFPTFEILRCDYLFQWVHKGIKYECPGVLRSQNSYNSGLWLDYKIQSVQDQQKFAVPLNFVTETLFYNHRMIIDSNIYNPDAEPRAWLISKINRVSPDGIARITLAQDTYDQHKDYIERSTDGNIRGMWANYWDSNVEPVPADEDIPLSNAKITCSGKPQFKIGGSSKTFTVSYYDSNNQEIIDHEIGSWSYTIDGEIVPEELLILSYTDNKVNVKFIGDDTFIGKIFTITNTYQDIVATMQVEIIGL